MTWKEDRECIFCKEKYTPTHKSQKYCSHACAAKVNGAKKTAAKTFEVCCGWCGKKFRKRLGQKGKTGDFCCVKCGQAFKRGYKDKYIEKTCPNCNENFTCLYRKQTTFCSVSCSKSGKNHPLYGKKFKWAEGKKAWTYGLTKETDQRIAALGKKVSKTHKRQFAEGVRSNTGINNPNHNKTRNRKKRSNEQLERYSKAAIKRIQSGMACSHKFLKTGWYVSTKTHKHMYHRSGYELTYMKFLDENPKVVWYEYEPFEIKYDTGRRYLPDFLVIWSSGKKELVEIKGEHLMAEERTERKIEAGKKFCHDNDMIFVLLTNKDIKLIEKQNGS